MTLGKWTLEKEQCLDSKVYREDLQINSWRQVVIKKIKWEKHSSSHTYTHKMRDRESIKLQSERVTEREYGIIMESLKT